MTYPTHAEVDASDHVQCARWYRYLASPGTSAVGKPEFQAVMDAEEAILDRIIARLAEHGGMTPAVSKAISP